MNTLEEITQLKERLQHLNYAYLLELKDRRRVLKQQLSSVDAQLLNLGVHPEKAVPPQVRASDCELLSSLKDLVTQYPGLGRKELAAKLGMADRPSDVRRVGNLLRHSGLFTFTGRTNNL